MGNSFLVESSFRLQILMYVYRQTIFFDDNDRWQSRTWLKVEWNRKNLLFPVTRLITSLKIKHVSFFVIWKKIMRNEFAEKMPCLAKTSWSDVVWLPQGESIKIYLKVKTRDRDSSLNISPQGNLGRGMPMNTRNYWGKSPANKLHIFIS